VEEVDDDADDDDLLLDLELLDLDCVDPFFGMVHPTTTIPSSNTSQVGATIERTTRGLQRSRNGFPLLVVAVPQTVSTKSFPHPSREELSRKIHPPG
jgi:hypothetical protein